MPSPTVQAIRALLRDRAEEGRPISMAERALLLATLAPPARTGTDVVDELEAAIAYARGRLLDSRAELPEEQRRAATRLLAAARGVLEHAPEPLVDDDPPPIRAGVPVPAAPAAELGGRPWRADVDG